MKDRAGHLYDEEVILALQPMASGFSLEAHDDGSGTMLTIAELREGMELTRDLVSANGILLMVSGTILNESAIARLKRMSWEDRRHLKVSVKLPAEQTQPQEE